MLLINSSLEGVPVMSLQNGTKLGTTSEPIIDPRKLQVVAFRVVGPRIFEESVLHTSDIREVGPLGLIVNAADDIMALDHSLVRLNEIISLDFSIIGKTVIDDTKKKLGKVSEYSVDDSSFMVMKIHVSQSIMKNLSSTSLLISRSQIKEITDKAIIVHSTVSKSTTGLSQILNPFKKKPTGQLSTD